MSSNTTSSLTPSGNAADASTAPVVCDLSAIPANQRDAHVQLARALFADRDNAVREVEDGLLVELPVERLGDAARFVGNERLCCRHLAFAIEVPPRSESLALRVTGVGAREELRALLR